MKNFTSFYKTQNPGTLQSGLAKLFILIIILGYSSITWGQTTIYSQDFNASGSFPTGWSSSNSTSNPWYVYNGNNLSPIPPFSGGYHLVSGNTTNTRTLTYSNSLSTVGFTSITVIWAARRVNNYSPTFSWSSDGGSNWNTVAFTDVANNATWAWVNETVRINLSAGAEEKSDLRFRWQISNSSQSYRLDDFSVQGTPIPTCPTITATVDSKSDITCFNDNDGSITVLASGGVTPYSFSKDNGANYEPINNFPTAGKHTFSALSANVVYRIRVKDNNGCESAILP